jgi:hypothetical protein
MSLFSQEFSKVWCYLKGKDEKIEGIWDFENGVLSQGSEVLTEANLQIIIDKINNQGNGGSSALVAIFGFSASDNVINIDNWQQNFFRFFSNGKFLLQFKDENGNLQDRPDVGATRIVDRTGIVPIQTGLLFNQPYHPEGQIIIEYLNFPI